MDLARRVLPGLIGVWLVVLNPSLPAPLAAQSRAQVTARARVLAVGPSREAIAAGLGVAVVGRRAAHSTLATVRIGPPPVEPIISEGGFRRRRSVVLRIDFLRN